MQPNIHNPNTIRAKKLLRYYFTLVFENAGLHWDSDNAVEIDDIVDSLLMAVIALVQEQHEGVHENYLEARRP